MNSTENKKPSYITIANTGRCNSRCVTCGAWQTPASEKELELSIEEWKQVFDKLHRWLGEYGFVFSGGEPFFKNDIFELIEYAATHGAKVDIVTNGLALKGKYEEIINSKLANIILSLNSVKDPKIHIASRGLEESFKKTIDSIQTLTYLNRKYNKGKNITISTILMPENLDEVKPLAEFVKTEGIGVSFQLLDDGSAFIPPEGNEKPEYFNNIKQKVLDAIDLMAELKNQGYTIYNSYQQLEAFKTLITEPEKIQEIVCQVGDRNLAISGKGDVKICFCMDDIGSILTETPENLWKNEKAENVRKQILECKRNCRLLNCNFEA